MSQSVLTPSSVRTGQPPLVLVAVSDPSLPLIERALREEQIEYRLARTASEAVWFAEKSHPALILLDVALSGSKGFQVCEQLKQSESLRLIPVMFLSSRDDVQLRSYSLQVGGVDFLAKPFQLRELVLRVRYHLAVHLERLELLQRNEVLRRKLDRQTPEPQPIDMQEEAPLLGESPAAQLLRQAVQLYAPTEQSVLLTGPPGAGYQAIARAIHRHSNRSSHTFLYVNCTMLQEEQSSSFLTTSISQDMLDGVGQRSQFFHAHEGTLFLDRVDELPLTLQKKLLVILQKAQEARRQGKVPDPDVRILSYTLEDLYYAVQRGTFLSELLPLLSEHRIVVPALTERRQDIPEIANFLLQQGARRLGKVVERISVESTRRLMEYSWPGNIDELQQLLEREVAITQSPVLHIDTHLLEEGISLDRYRLIRKLGAGGMGEVWHAKHRWLARSVAVKWVRPDPHLPPKEKQRMIQRFQREAQVISQLTSPYTVTLYDFGVEPSGTFYYVMELLDGMEMQTLVERFGPLPPERLVPILRKVCRSLMEAHVRQLIHRDIKPENIYICKKGVEYDVPTVLDFGIVKAQDNEAPPLHTERKGAIGTPGYMAPEAVTRKTALDARSDLYALGCVAYWALTGRPVFLERDPIALLRQHVYEQPSLPSQWSPHPIPVELERLVMACIEKEPERRPPSAQTLWEWLGMVPLDAIWSEEHARLWWKNNVTSQRPSTESAPTLPVSEWGKPTSLDSRELVGLSSEPPSRSMQTSSSLRPSSEASSPYATEQMRWSQPLTPSPRKK